ncbi:MAG: hypothetical protein MUO58_20760, partial [Anaerolineales bacterium]|nr:hypothetical protein [Anaerolineales bacterium]
MRRYNQSIWKGVGVDHPRKDFLGIEWVGFRDRATGRAKRYATQTAEAIENAREREPDEGESEGAPWDEEAAGVNQDWFDQAWPDLKTLLIEEQRNCQTAAIFQWRDCLFRQAASGASQDE